MLKPAIVAGLVLLVPSALHLVRKRFGAPARYYGVLLGGPLVVLAILASALFLDRVPTVRFALGVVVYVFPLLAAGYSLQALTTDSPIPRWVSIPVLVISSIGTLYVLMAIMLSGGGYIVG
jgi:hypothetical protein